MTRPRHPPSALATLLDALEAELLAAPAEEVRDALRETGRARDSACQEIRTLLDDATAADADASPAPTSHDLGDRPGLHWH